MKQLKLRNNQQPLMPIQGTGFLSKRSKARLGVLLIAALSCFSAPLVIAATSSHSTNQPEWAPQDNGSDISWQAATEYCQSLGQNWRLPTPAELLGLFDPTESVRCGWNYCHTRRDLSLSGNWFWSNQSQTNNHAVGVNLDLGRVDKQKIQKGLDEHYV